MVLNIFLYAYFHPPIRFGAVSVEVFPYFLVGLFIFLLLSFKSSFYILAGYKPFVKNVFCKYFLPICGLSSYLLIIFHKAKILSFDEIHIISCLSWIVILMSGLRTLHLKSS